MNPTQNAQPGQYPQGYYQGGRPPGGFAGGRHGAFLFLGPYGSVIMAALIVLTYVVLAVSYWKFLSKAGLTPAIALLMLVPVVNLGVALWVAFAEWPALKEVARLKELVATYELRATQSTATPAAATTPPAP